MKNKLFFLIIFLFIVNILNAEQNYWDENIQFENRRAYNSSDMLPEMLRMDKLKHVSFCFVI